MKFFTALILAGAALTAGAAHANAANPTATEKAGYAEGDRLFRAIVETLGDACTSNDAKKCGQEIKSAMLEANRQGIIAGGCAKDDDREQRPECATAIEFTGHLLQPAGDK
ncbi:hypothetical protein KYT24_004392 [Salmonella enterica]|nr:hypothetical protein [Salmonella enterica]